MMSPTGTSKPKTFFAIDEERSPIKERSGHEPYSVSMQKLEREEHANWDSSEYAAFSQVLEHEVAFYEPRGMLAGPIVLFANGKRADCRLRPFPIPGFVENDAVQFEASTARGILLVENMKIFDLLNKADFCHKLDYLLVTGSGIPRTGTRRLLHRLQREVQLPLYLLTDNDTWGYFIYSILKRGLLAPIASCPFLAIQDVQYLGIQAGEALAMNMDNVVYRPWKSLWDQRLTAMRSYDCFQSNKWRAEFDQFEIQASAVDLFSFISHMGNVPFIDSYLASRL